MLQPVAEKDDNPYSSLKRGSPMLMSYEYSKLVHLFLDFHYFGKYQSILSVPALRCILSVYPFTVVYPSILLSSSHVPFFSYS